jgi:tetratricopeptide (TPR) repeat protein
MQNWKGAHPMLNQSSNKPKKPLAIGNGILSLATMVLFLTLLTGGCTTMPSTNVPARMTEPSVDVTSRHQQAVKLMQKEQWQAAVDMLEAITTKQPALSGPWVNLGITYTKRGDSKAAEAAFKQAIDVNATNVEACNQLGILYRRTGRYEEARLIYETALETEPDNTSLHWNLAILHDTDLPDPRKALLHYQRYQQITGSDNPHLLSWINNLAKDQQTSSMAARVNP